MSRRLRVLEVNKFYPPHIGGIETVIEQHSRLLAGMPDTEVRVLVCQEKGRHSVSVIDGVEVTRCGSLGTYFSMPLSVSFLRQFRKLAAWADVVEFHTPFPLGDLACLLSHCRCRVVVAWHSDVVRQKHLLALYKPVLHQFLKRADSILTATPGHISGSAFLPEFRDKCVVLPYPLELERYAQTRRFPILTDRLHCRSAVKVLFAGRLVYYKGVSFLIEAFRRVHGAELFICGTGPLENELRQSAGDTVHFLGRLSNEQLRAAFADCDLFVLPSVERSEAFGIVQQEAMFYGKPVINTSLPGGVPYVSLHGETGLTVRPKDPAALAGAIQRLTDDAALREKLGRNAAERVRSAYDSRMVMQKLRAVLQGCPEQELPAQQ